jgi:peptidoglycan/xylan/chitin deacetylase (PgdA/CDA1 family)
VPDEERGEDLVFAYENEEKKGPIEYAASFILSAYGLAYRICSYSQLDTCHRAKVLISYGTSLPKREESQDPHAHILESGFWGDKYLTAGSLPDQPLRNFQGVPVLYWGNSNHDDESMRNQERGATIIPADLIASSFFMLSRYEEVVSNDKDRFARFPAEASAMGKAGFLHRPVVNEYIELLWDTLLALKGDLVRDYPWGEKSFALCLTHDIDRIRLYANPKHILGTLWRVGIKRGDIRGGLGAIRDAFGTWLGLRIDPYDTFQQLMALEAELDIKATYFFMSGGRTAYDNRYHISKLGSVLRQLRKAGHEVGLHASFASYHDADRLREEKEQLENVLSNTALGSRQHYLRWETPTTWAALARAGFYYDTTLGYAQHEGFRAGTCYPFHPYDVLSDQVLPIWEVPLIVMDSTLLGYRGLKTDEAKEAVMQMVAQAKRYRGVFVLLWHNSSLYDLVQPGVSAAFGAIMKETCSEDPLKDTITETLRQWEAHVRQQK